MIERILETKLKETLQEGFSFFLFGPRQSGKTTLVNMLLKKVPHIKYDLLVTRTKLRLEADPTIFREEILAAPEKIIFVDEIQKVPALLDEIQSLIDEHKKVFALTGSSARKLKRKGTNLLLGRALTFKLFPFTLDESAEILPDFSRNTLKKILKYGELPEVIKLVFGGKEKLATQLLYSYTETYLEEEIRAEAFVRQLGNFSRFLRIAGELSGKRVSFRALSQDIGVSHITIGQYYQILEDTMISVRIPSFPSHSEGGKTARANKFLFFDLGIVNSLCGQLEAQDMPSERWGDLFEQWVGLYLLKTMYHKGIRGELFYWRDKGKEIDWVLCIGDKIIPIEVKWGETIRRKDMRTMEEFLNRFSSAKEGFFVFTGERRRKLTERITAIPWHELRESLNL